MGKKKGQGNHQLQASSSTTTVWRATDGGRGVSARGKGFETAFADGSDGRFESLPAGYATSRYAVLTKESSRNDADLGNLDDEDAYDSGSDDPIQEEQSSVAIRKRSISVRLCMWEFGQNDPKRDSGVKLRRMGFADSLKLGQSFPGVVLSSEATTYISAADLDIVNRFGIAGINCSWNRLEEIPFGRMGHGRNQRILPLLFAANSVNYGRPFKMNTAEAMAACLYIVGLKADAEKIMEPFGYGPEFIRLNFEALTAYSNCSTSSEVEALHKAAIAQSEKKSAAKDLKHELDRGVGGTICTNYLNDMDMPPADDEYDYYDDDVDEGPEDGVLDEMEESGMNSKISSSIDADNSPANIDVGISKEHSHALPMDSSSSGLIDIGINLLDEMFSGIYNGKQRHLKDTRAVLQRAKDCNVEKMIVTLGQLDECRKVLEEIPLDLMEEFGLTITVGIHPTRCSIFSDASQHDSIRRELCELIEVNIERGIVSAIGECGLDYDRLQFCSKEHQAIGFIEQMKLSARYSLPLFLHNRNTDGEFVNMLKANLELLQAGGVVHSFDGSIEEMQTIVELGFYIGINGCSLKTKDNLEMVRNIPLDRLMLETDAPYCGIKNTHASKAYVRTEFPTKKYDKYDPNSLVKDRCEPCMLVQVLEAVAAIKGIDETTLARQVHRNTVQLFFSNKKG